MIYQNKWLCSYETLLFDTADGDLGINQYAESENGYYIRTKDKSDGHFQFAERTYDVSQLTKVKIIGKAYYDEFLTAEGAKSLWAANSKYKTPDELPPKSIIRIRSTAQRYNSLQIRNNPQPSRAETVSKLPPAEPKALLPEHHSIAFDAASNSGVKSAVTSISWNHTCGASANLLVVGSGTYNATPHVSSATYDGVACTQIRTDADGSSVTRSTLLYLLAPVTGSAKTVTVNYNDTVQYGGAGAVSYSGVAQQAPDANNGAANTSGTVATVDVTTVADNCWVAAVSSMYYAISGLTCGNTSRYAINTYGAGNGSDNNAPKTPAGAVTMNFTATTSSYWSISAASFAPMVAPTVTTQAATSVEATTATGNGTVVSNGGATLTERGIAVCIDSHSETPDKDDTLSVHDHTNAEGAFTESIINLAEGTTYHARAYATNSVGTSYGALVHITTDIGDTLVTLWNARKVISDTSIEKWNVRQAISDTVKLVHNVSAAISDTIQVIYNVLVPISDTVQFIWNVECLIIADTIQLVWNTRKAISDTSQYVWNVLTIVPDTIQLVWNTRQTVSDTLQTIWNTRYALSDTLQTIWNVKTYISDTIQFVFNVRKAISDTSQLIWNTGQAISDTLQTIWNTRYALSDTVQLVWNVKKAISDTLQTIWNVRFALSDTIQAIWNTRKAISDTLQTIWNVRAVVSDTLQTIWNVRKAISDTLQTIWNVRKAISDTTQLIWNTRFALSDTVQFVYNVRKAISDTLQLIWNVKITVSDTVQFVWNVRKAISDTIKLVWNAVFTWTYPVALKMFARSFSIKFSDRNITLKLKRN